MTPGQGSAGALPERRCLQRIVVTTDVHSALDHAPLLASHLHALRGGALPPGPHPERTAPREPLRG